MNKPTKSDVVPTTQWKVGERLEQIDTGVEAVAMVKPTWRKFPNELPTVGKDIYVTDPLNDSGSLHKDYFEHTNTFGGLVEYQCNNATYSSYCYWTYADELDLSLLLPNPQSQTNGTIG